MSAVRYSGRQRTASAIALSIFALIAGSRAPLFSLKCALASAFVLNLFNGVWDRAVWIILFDIILDDFNIVFYDRNIILSDHFISMFRGRCAAFSGGRRGTVRSTVDEVSPCAVRISCFAAGDS